MNIPIDIINKYRDLLSVAAISGKTVYENELTRISNLKVNRVQKITINYIFITYWHHFLKHFNDSLRPAIIKNVNALINCKDLSKGHLFLECSNCDNFHLLGLSCNSRFCTSCGQRYRSERSLNIQSKLLDSPHRHFVFSIPFNLRPFFWHCRSLFYCLFKSVSDAFDITLAKSKSAKRRDERAGFVAFLHTSGRSLNPHPHLHVLLAERTVDKLGKLKKIHYFYFKRLKTAFMYRFLELANKEIKALNNKTLYNKFNTERSIALKKYRDGFYVHGPANKKSNHYIKSSKAAADYISRYDSHPPIAESNILSLNEITNEITWTYTPHEDPDNPVVITEHVFKFIAKLIRHIPDNKTHVLRYYGFYANRTNRIKKLSKLFNYKNLKHQKSQLKWRIMIKRTYKFDPILCNCGSLLKVNFNYSYFGKYDWRDFDA